MGLGVGGTGSMLRAFRNVNEGRILGKAQVTVLCLRICLYLLQGFSAFD